MSGRTMDVTQPAGAASGRTEVLPISTGGTSGRANVASISSDQASGRTILNPQTVATASGRTNVAAKPKNLASGRAVTTPKTASRAPGRTKIQPHSGTRASGPDPYALLLFNGDLLDDIERVRIANENRLRSLTSEQEWGKGMSATLPEVALLASIVEQLGAIEHGLELQLKRVFRTTPLADWQRRTPGIGEKQLARLLAVTGDPAERPNPAKLWAYCGHGDPARRRIKGMTQDEARALGNPKAKSRTYLIAESCIKQTGGGATIAAQPGRTTHRRSPYRDVYETARTKYAIRDWTLGHQHAAALRLVGKTILRDMWIEARND